MSNVILLSHPPDDDHPHGRPLAQHLDEVDRVAESILSRHPGEAYAAAGFDTRAVLHALAGWHDLGKGTAFFQDYIADPDAFNRRAIAGDPDAEPHLKDHTPIGAFLAVRRWSRALPGSE
jgi:HD domain